MKLFKHIEYEGGNTKTIKLGKCEDGNNHPTEMYITLPGVITSATLKAIVDGLDVDVSAYNAATYEKAETITGVGVYVALVAPYEEINLYTVGEGTVKVDLYE